MAAGLLPGVLGFVASLIVLAVLMRRFFDTDLIALFIVVVTMKGLEWLLLLVLLTLVSMLGGSAP